ncbi:hypothetical protein KIN20_007720 [Parelaphostrongylus tenuis]|uniref:G-protein coupled receptors family 1 profile domain-containing protein n=1 Tax=Parelaphostrongylus tenuis TaxID=148309 RepID=A0AAD5MVV4_PARTN|nr:hypothetical protein KIN20_007720 [Parelaphostrongylus tenuis]
MLWYVCLYSHLVIAFNRVIAIAFPLRAFAVLTVRKTYLIALICWMLGILHILPNFSTDSCYFLFDAVKWKFIFSKTSCGYIIFAINLYNVHAILILILLLDSTTSICLRIKHKLHHCSVPLSFLSSSYESTVYATSDGSPEREDHP